MQMLIRAAQPADAEQIEALFKEFVTYLRSIGDNTNYVFGAQRYLEDGFGPDPAFRGLVAEDLSRLMGYALFCKGYDGDYVRRFYLIDLYVQEADRGRGVGRMLMNAVVEIARKEQVPRVSWAVHKNNSLAIRFYERLGAQYSDDCHAMYVDLAI